MNTHIPTEDPILEWQAPQHLHHERTRMWYICAGIFVAGCTAYSIFTTAWTFTAILILVTGAYWRVHREQPQNRHMQIWKNGFAIDGNFFEWKDVNGYWILQGNGYHEMHIELTTGRHIKIQTADINPYDIHDVLHILTTELTDRKENILDTIIRICKL